MERTSCSSVNGRRKGHCRSNSIPMVEERWTFASGERTLSPECSLSVPFPIVHLSSMLFIDLEADRIAPLHPTDSVFGQLEQFGPVAVRLYWSPQCPHPHDDSRFCFRPFDLLSLHPPIRPSLNRQQRRFLLRRGRRSLPLLIPIVVAGSSASSFARSPLDSERLLPSSRLVHLEGERGEKGRQEHLPNMSTAERKGRGGTRRCPGERLLPRRSADGCPNTLYQHLSRHQRRPCK